MQKTAYLFEVRGVQDLLFAGGKLRDVVAISDQLDALCGTPLDDVLRVCDLQESNNIWFSRRASGAIYAILDSASKALQLQNLWSFYVRKHFPGVEIVQTIHTADNVQDAMDCALKKMASQRNILVAQHPVPAPLVKRSPRTGKAVVEFDQSRKEWVDEATRITRSNLMHNVPLFKKFTHKNYELHWPISIDPEDDYFPFIDDNHSLALIHADGNSMGEMLIILSAVISQASNVSNEENLYMTMFRMFSDAMEAATQQAALDATQVLIDSIPLDSVMPARPLVLGGDDLTIIVRADLAIAFTKKFCQAFEQHTACQLATLNAKIKELNDDSNHIIIDGVEHKLDHFQFLSACAGIAFIKAKQPFLQTYDLAESLCHEAKVQSRNSMIDRIKPIPSSISFHKVSSTLIQDVDQIRIQEWQVICDQKVYDLSMAAYNLEDLETISQLADLFGEGKLNKSGLRKVAGLMKVDLILAQKKYTRWREISAKHTPNELRHSSAKQDHETLLDRFDWLISKLINCSVEQIPIDQTTNKSPLLDLLLILDLPKSPSR